jgi:Protein of unknown function (DUF1778)
MLVEEGIHTSISLLSRLRVHCQYNSVRGPRRFVLDETQWKLFLEALDRPAKKKPRLKKLFSERHVATRRSRKLPAIQSSPSRNSGRITISRYLIVKILHSLLG